MYNIFRKLEQRTPKTEQDEDFSVREFEDKSLERYSQHPQGPRPLSAKVLEKRIGVRSKRKQVRPTSAKRNFNTIASKFSKIQADNQLLSRLKPTYILMDKERLYEENMALKLEINGYKVENMRIRTKLTQIEKEILKKDELIEEIGNHDRSPGRKYVRLVSSLKQNIKEIKQESKTKEEELTKLKKNMRSSKISELEIEIQTYMDECVRLKHSMEELMRRKLPETSLLAVEDAKYQSSIISNLKKEKQELLIAISELQDENNKLKEKVPPSSEKGKKKPTKKDVNASLKLEIQKLRAQIDGYARDTKDKDTGHQEEIDQINKKHNLVKNKLEAEEKRNKDLVKQIEVFTTSSKKSVQAEFIMPKESPSEVKKNPQNKKKSPTAIPVIIQKIHEICLAKKMIVSVFLSLLDRNHNGYLEVDEFIKGMKQYKQEVPRKDVEELCEVRHGKLLIPLSSLEQAYDNYISPESDRSSFSYEEPVITATLQEIPKFSFENPPAPVLKPLIKENEVKIYFRHIALSMQLHRSSKQELAPTLFGLNFDVERVLSKRDLVLCFKNPPFVFMEKIEAEKLCEFLVQPKGEYIEESELPKMKLSIGGILDKLNLALTDWKIFKPEEENEFDGRLSAMIIKNKDKLIALCTSYDVKKTEMITLAEFRLALANSGIITDPRLFEYMSLLFYSHNNEIERVPYNDFIAAYSESPAQEQYSDEEKLEIIKFYLGAIAQALIKTKCTVREAFHCEQDLIYPESFISGLEYLNLKDIEHDVVLMILEQLQYEKETENCIFIEEFEKIMENYGVSVGKKSDRRSHKSFSSKGSSEGSSGKIKKFSIIESENFEYSEDSPDKYGISEISPFASVMNPEVQRTTPVMKDNSELEKVSDRKSSGYSSGNFEKEKVAAEVLVEKNKIRGDFVEEIRKKEETPRDSVSSEKYENEERKGEGFTNKIRGESIEALERNKETPSNAREQANSENEDEVRNEYDEDFDGEVESEKSIEQKKSEARVDIESEDEYNEDISKEFNTFGEENGKKLQELAKDTHEGHLNDEESQDDYEEDLSKEFESSRKEEVKVLAESYSQESEKSDRGIINQLAPVEGLVLHSEILQKPNPSKENISSKDKAESDEEPSKEFIPHEDTNKIHSKESSVGYEQEDYFEETSKELIEVKKDHNNPISMENISEEVKHESEYEYEESKEFVQDKVQGTFSEFHDKNKKIESVEVELYEEISQELSPQIDKEAPSQLLHQLSEGEEAGDQDFTPISSHSEVLDTAKDINLDTNEEEKEKNYDESLPQEAVHVEVGYNEGIKEVINENVYVDGEGVDEVFSNEIEEIKEIPLEETEEKKGGSRENQEKLKGEEEEEVVSFSPNKVDEILVKDIRSEEKGSEELALFNANMPENVGEMDGKVTENEETNKYDEKSSYESVPFKSIEEEQGIEKKQSSHVKSESEEGYVAEDAYDYNADLDLYKNDEIGIGIDREKSLSKESVTNDKYVEDTSLISYKNDPKIEENIPISENYTRERLENKFEEVENSDEEQKSQYDKQSEDRDNKYISNKISIVEEKDKTEEIEEFLQSNDNQELAEEVLMENIHKENIEEVKELASDHRIEIDISLSSKEEVEHTEVPELGMLLNPTSSELIEKTEPDEEIDRDLVSYSEEEYNELKELANKNILMEKINEADKEDYLQDTPLNIEYRDKLLDSSIKSIPDEISANGEYFEENPSFTSEKQREKPIIGIANEYTEENKELKEDIVKDLMSSKYDEANESEDKTISIHNSEEENQYEEDIKNEFHSEKNELNEAKQSISDASNDSFY